MAIAEELRCLVCQNETIAASHADLAVDLRKQIAIKLQAGQSKQEIIDFMVAAVWRFCAVPAGPEGPHAAVVARPVRVAGGGRRRADRQSAGAGRAAPCRMLDDRTARAARCATGVLAQRASPPLLSER
jgi:hypothetical protein